MESLSYVIGVVFGAVLAIDIIVIAFKRGNTDGSMKTKYDERQEAIRGKGFKYGFYAALGYFVLMLIIGLPGFNVGGNLTIIAFTGIIVSGLANAGYCIWHGGYWGLNNNKGRYIRLLIALGIINMFGVVGIIKRGSIFDDGKLDTGLINVECGIFLLIILALIFIRDRKDKRENMLTDDEDEE